MYRYILSEGQLATLSERIDDAQSTVIDHLTENPTQQSIRSIYVALQDIRTVLYTDTRIIPKKEPAEADFLDSCTRAAEGNESECESCQ